MSPLTHEPLFPDPANPEEVKRKGWIPFPGGYVFERKDDSGRLLEAGVVSNGLILMDRGLIELLGCAEGGKEHESIVRVSADAQALDFGLILCGLKGGPVPERLADPKVVQGPRLVVLLQWLDEETGKTMTYRAEDIVVFYDPATGKNGPMPRVGWTYVGAMIEVADPGPGKKPGKVLASSASRSLMTTWRDRTTLLDNPLPDAANDKLFAANYMVLPSPGTPVRVVIRTPREEERREIAKAEEAHAK